MSDDWGDRLFDSLKKQRDKRDMNVIHKYLTEAKIKVNDQDIKKIISTTKSTMYDLNGQKVSVVVAPGTVILKYPSSMVDFTYNLAQTCDDLGYGYQQIGLESKKDMKFIIDKD